MSVFERILEKACQSFADLVKPADGKEPQEIKTTDVITTMKTKSASQTARKCTKKVVLLATTALALSMSAAFGATTYRNHGTGSWFDPNWDNGVPNSTTDAFINNGGTAQIFPATPSAEALSLTLGQNPGDSGRVSVGYPYGDLAVGGTIFVGYRGSGTLIITNPGGVRSGGASIASLTSGLWSSNGSASVDGTNSAWTVSTEVDVGGTTTGAGGTGLLKVTNGGTVSVTSTSPPGKVHVYASGTLTGNGTVSTAGETTIEGTIEPSGGRLTIGGNLTFAGTAALMQSNVVPASADNVYVSGGAASLTGRLKVTMTGTFTPGTTYTLLYADNGLSNTTFSSVSISYPTNQCFTPSVTYDAHNVYLNLVSCN